MKYPWLTQSDTGGWEAYADYESWLKGRLRHAYNDENIEQLYDEMYPLLQSILYMVFCGVFDEVDE